MNTVMVLEQRK